METYLPLAGAEGGPGVFQAPREALGSLPTLVPAHTETLFFFMTFRRVRKKNKEIG